MGLEEFGLRTMGLGWTEVQERLTTDPHMDGLPKTDEGEIVLKKPPRGRSP